jgi:putative ABC transport system ATP-binding protein
MRLQHVVKIYSSIGGPVTALNGIDLEIRQGEFVVVTGRSGSGKTTLVNCITGLDRCTSGEIEVAGTRVDQLGTERASYWRRKCGVVFQALNCCHADRSRECDAPMGFSDLSVRPSQACAGLLDAVEIADPARKVPAALSGGQQQRLAIARAMANDPPILIADEPTGSLDSATAEAVLACSTACTARQDVFLVTHDKDVAHASQGHRNLRRHR